MTTTKKPAGTPEKTAKPTCLMPTTSPVTAVAPTSASSHVLLKPSDIESEGGPTVATQYVWVSLNRHQWKAICLKIGRNLRYRRADWDAWKESRRMSTLQTSHEEN